MRVGTTNIKIFFEGIEVKNCSNLTLYVTEERAPTLQLTFPTTKNIRKLLPATLVQVFMRDQSEGEEWYLLFDGSLEKKIFQKTDEGENTSIICGAVESIFEKTYFTRYNIYDPISGITSDILYANLGRGSEAEATIPFRRPAGSGVSDNFLDFTLWNKWVQGKQVDLSAVGFMPKQILIGEDNPYSDKGGFSGFMHSVLRGIPMNSPYVKIIEDSLKVIERYKIYPSDAIFELSKEVAAFNSLHKELIQSSSTQSYRKLIGRIAQLALVEIKHLGIPCLDQEGDFVSTIMIPGNEFVVPPIQNLIFPNEFDRYQVNFNFDAEPTRALNTSFTTNVGSFLGINGVSVMPTFLSPSNELLLDPVQKTSDGNLQYYLKFTDEEKYRGVNPTQLAATFHEYAYAQLFKKGEVDVIFLTEKEALEETKKRGMKDEVGYFKRMLYISDYLYYKKRLASRGIGTISVPYFNPNWIIGFPGLVILPDHGPILVNFKGFTITISADGRAKTELRISNPRFMDEDTLVMDLPQPAWYESYLHADEIGKKVYNAYSKYGNSDFEEIGSSIVDVVNTIGEENPIEAAANILWSNKDAYIPFEKRKRRFVDTTTYFEFLKVNVDADGFPSPAVTYYRESKDLDAYTIAIAAQNSDDPLSYLECPYVYERGIKVLEWLGLEAELMIGEDFKAPEITEYKDAPSYGTEDKGSSDYTIKETVEWEANKKWIYSTLQNYILTKEEAAKADDSTNLAGVPGKRFNLTARDLRTGKGTPRDFPGDPVNISTNLCEFMFQLEKRFPNQWRITNLLSAHDKYINDVTKLRSPHSYGRGLDLVGMLNGKPDANVTQKIEDWAKTSIEGKHYDVTRVIWHLTGTGLHSPKDPNGMHLHITVGS